MAQSPAFNPFEKWLGLRAGLTRPSYFQLLLLSPKLVDQPDWQRRVQEAADAQLAKLDRVPPGHQEALQQQLRQRIEKARTVLLDDGLRQRYLQQLRAAGAQSDSAGGPEGDGTPTPPAAVPRATPLPATSEVPMAIPVARPVAAEDSPVTPTPTIITPDSQDIPRIRKSRKRRQGSRWIAWLAMAAMIGMMVGGSALLYFNFDAVVAAVSGRSPASDAPPEPVSPAPVPGGPPQPDTEPADEPLPAPQITTDPPPAMGADSEALPETPTDPAPETAPQTPPADQAWELTRDQLLRLGHHLDQALRNLQRRQLDQAQAALDRAQSLLAGWRPANQDLSPTQAFVTSRLSSIEALLRLSRDFWKRVARSSQTIRGIPALEVGEEVAGFVEADANTVTLRIAGNNIPFDYGFLPEGLAIALVEANDIDNTTAWNLELAAIYAVNRRSEDQFAEKIGEYLTIARSGNADCEPIEYFLDTQFHPPGPAWDRVQLDLDAPPPAWLADIRTQLGLGDPQRATAARAVSALAQLETIEWVDAEDLAALLLERYRLAGVAGDASLVEDCADDLSKLSQLERSSLLRQGYLAVSAQRLDASRTRDLLERAIDFLRSPDGQLASPDRARLIEQLIAAAQRYQMQDALDRLAGLVAGQP